ncbi:hypothetical protein H072_10640 [Dactylellina haptotyla CBS 200.50]|uniref:Carboxylesterase type B domain-containing protein n=1 Tax=Dactylellina haptotyla (strain CBS 200.50) TaxID=1284197 RepID=S8B9Z6_DACHA|nr:hypothetical protein H072_10640 [Dactylellina haptotyla CBS 200.50]
MSTISHPALGSLRGVTFASTIQYRNIPYARFNGRFKEATLSDGPISSSGTVYDATEWGPLCPQTKNGIKFDFALAGVELPHIDDYRMSEEEGLNAVITVPKDIQAGAKLPVIVWIHGGYWVVGGNSWPQYDLQNLVELSIRLGSPVIGVAFNYRLGVAGLLASEDLESNGNFGIKDQVLGFQWLQKHIAGFGGDPSNITAFGESAGAMLLSTLLQLSSALFNKALVMSGSATLRPSKTELQQKALYNDVINHLNLAENTAKERVEELSTRNIESIISSLPPLLHVGPSLEPGFLDEIVTLETISEKTTPSWCDEIVIGDCFHDASCFKTRVLNHENNAAYFIACIESVLEPASAQAIINSYHIAASNSPEESLVHCMELLTDLRWYLPILHFALDQKQGSSTAISRYHFHQTNKFDCQWKGLAAHLFDITLLLQNHSDLLQDDDLKLSKDMAERFLNFAYGRGFVSEAEGGSEGNVVVWGPNGHTKIVSADEYDEMLRNGRGRLLRSLGWETCEELANALQFGPKK